ncbi:helix-turn-helix domain-containing protein [Amycolatopsis sp. NPDC051716]|uniref:helix-turn-helix domain-containing protein n=1 Tax=Amycolatopsis sp. NPDC051716 TaxID=3155804 RepID=UPI0034354856
MSVHVTGAEGSVIFTGRDAFIVASALASYARAFPREARAAELQREARRAAEGYVAEHRKLIADLRSSADSGTNGFRKAASGPSSAPTDTEWITTEEAAQRLQVTPEYVRRLARQGRLTARRTTGRGAAWEINAADVATWVPRLSA